MMNFSVEIPWGVPSKKNRYQIRFNPKFWDLIKPLVTRLREQGAKRLYWVSPDQEVVRFENNAAWPIKSELIKFRQRGGDLRPRNPRPIQPTRENRSRDCRPDHPGGRR